MSFVRDVLGFERFALNDMLKTIRKDPERLLVGALDPFSTRIWNKTGIGKDWEPVVDQWGGPYSGNSLGGGTGGVYGRAQAAGVPTGPGGQMHEAARTIAGIFAGGYGAGKLPSFGGGGSMAQGQGPKWLQNMMGNSPWRTPPFFPTGATPPFVPGPTPGPSMPSVSTASPSRFQGPAWLQKFAGGLNRVGGSFAGPDSPYLTADENAARRQQQQMAIAGALLSAARPVPRGTSSPIGDLGAAMQAAQQSGDQFTADALRAKLMQAQIASANQGSAAPSAIREMQALGYPLTPEGFKEYNAAQGTKGTTINLADKLNEPIPIAQLDTVRLPDGTTPPIGTTYSEARAMGARVLSTADQQRTQQADQALGILNQLEELAIGPDGVFTEVEPGLANRAASAIQFGLDMLEQKDPRASQFADMSKATLAPFIKFLGETGSLAQGDVERALGLVPRIFPLPDTGEVAKEKLDALREIITRGVRNMNSVKRQSEEIPELPPGFTLDPE